jgi:probable HAF family extracellular repeat protein
MFRRSAMVLVGLVGLLMGYVCGSAPANTLQYAVTDLGVLAGTTHSAATAINNNGQVAGASFMVMGNPRAFLWMDGSAMQSLEALPEASITLGKWRAGLRTARAIIMRSFGPAVAACKTSAGYY